MISESGAVRHNDDDHAVGLRLYSGDDEANFHDNEGPRSKEELHSVPGGEASQVDLVESAGAPVSLVGAANQGQISREIEETIESALASENSSRR